MGKAMWKGESIYTFFAPKFTKIMYISRPK